MKIYKSTVGEIKTVYDKTNPIPKVKISCSEDSVETLREIIQVNFPGMISHREFMLILLLNRANNTMGWSLISVGGITGTVVDPKIVFQFAITGNASGIILCHNHPSGNLIPSRADDQITDKMVKAGKLLDINVLDHIIITDEDYYSYADEGRL